jgi:hypothetical protein
MIFFNGVWRPRRDAALDLDGGLVERARLPLTPLGTSVKSATIFITK